MKKPAVFANSAATLWFVSPVYHDVESYAKLRANLSEELRRLPGPPFKHVRFVVVDDTAGKDAAIEGLSGVEVVTPPFNLGHQRAIVYGLRKVAASMNDSDVVVTLDADGEDQPSDLPALLAALYTVKASSPTVVLAWRTKRRESFRFKAMYFAFKTLFKLLTGTIIRTGNFAVYRGWIARTVLFHPHFDLCYSSSLISLNLNAIYVPCERGRRYAGQSRMSTMKLIMHGIRMLIPFMERISIRALVLNAGLLALSLVSAVGLVLNRLFVHWASPPWLLAAIFVCMGVSIVAIGNLIVLFTVFSQSQGVFLKGIDEKSENGIGKSPRKAAV